MYKITLRAVALATLLLLTPYSAALAVETISGTITATAGGQPLASIDLDAFDAVSGAAVTITGGKSDASGNYTFTLPGPGSYIVRADPTAAQGVAAQYYNGAFLKSAAQAVNVGAGAAVSGIDFSLPAGVSITGTVSSGGSPLADIDIDVYASNQEFLSAYPAKTLADGSFEVGALPPGDYFVRADPDIALDTQLYVRSFYGGSPDILTATPITVGATNVTAIDIPLTAGGTIRGTVTDASTASPLSGYDLDLYDTLGNRVSLPGKTDVNGAYELGAIAPGTYRIRVDPTLAQGHARTYYPGVADEADGAPVGVVAGARTSNVDFALQQGGTISGTIVEAAGGTPLLGIDLDLYTDAQAFMSSYTASSDASGNYQFGPLLPGTYYLRADPSAAQGFAQQYYSGRSDINLADPVVVTGGADTPGVDFALTAAGAISGTIFDAGATPLAGVDLDLLDATGVRLRKGAATAVDGTYTIDSLAAGNYLLRADPSAASGFPRVYYNAKVTASDADLIVVAAGATTGAVDFTLPQAATVSGKVLDDQGGPVPQTAIEIYEVQGASQILVDQGGSTDLSGAYSVASLPPADYVVRAVPAPAVSVPYYYGDTTDSAAATVVTLTAGENRGNVNITLVGLTATAQSPDQQSCINGLNRDFAKVAKAQSKQVAKCIKSKSTGRLSGAVDACMNSDPRQKVARAASKTVSDEIRNCAAQVPDIGPTNSTTVNQAAVQGEIDLAYDIFGSGVDSAIFPSAGSTATLGRCQNSVVKQLQKCRLAQFDGFNACKKSGLSDASVALPGSLEGCLGADPRSKVAKACDASTGKLGSIVTGTRCAISGANIAAAFPGCGSATLIELAACLEAKTRCGVCRTLNGADELSGNCELVDDGLSNGSCP